MTIAPTERFITLQTEVSFKQKKHLASFSHTAITSKKAVWHMAKLCRAKCVKNVDYTNFCIQFQIILKSMRSQCHGQRKSLTVQLISTPVRRIELHTKVCNVFFGICLAKSHEISSDRF